MHDLNHALESLRDVMPYSKNPSVRKLSKISTMILARNYILSLQQNLDELKKMVRASTRKTCQGPRGQVLQISLREGTVNYITRGEYIAIPVLVVPLNKIFKIS